MKKRGEGRHRPLIGWPRLPRKKKKKKVEGRLVPVKFKEGKGRSVCGRTEKKKGKGGSLQDPKEKGTEEKEESSDDKSRRSGGRKKKKSRCRLTPHWEKKDRCPLPPPPPPQKRRKKKKDKDGHP